MPSYPTYLHGFYMSYCAAQRSTPCCHIQLICMGFRCLTELLKDQLHAVLSSLFAWLLVLYSLTELLEVLVLELELHDLLVDDDLHVLVVSIAAGLTTSDLLQLSTEIKTFSSSYYKGSVANINPQELSVFQ